MRSNDLGYQWASSYLSADSMSYLEALYEDFLENPNSVPSQWQALFREILRERVAPAGHQEVPHRAIRDYFSQKKRPQAEASAPESKQSQVTNLINAYRALGHHAAKLDPLDLAERMHVPALDLAYHQLSPEDNDKVFAAGKYFNADGMPLSDIVQALKDTYCGSIGIEYLHISNAAETEWLQEKLESARGKFHFSKDEKRAILHDLILADGLERYLGTRYVGQKRFSLEGGDALIPLMKALIEKSGEQELKEMVIGMAHRGRLNLLVNVLGKEPDRLFQEFEGKINTERTGDVKYHLGFASNLETKSGKELHVVLAFNPSHLEIISPVVEGSARARLQRYDDLAQKKEVLPVLIHGDAAFAGQGVIMETFNFSQARGYATGGTVHVVINNQIGFTTSNPLDARSTLYCTDVAKMVQAPVLHVNGDDPEAVVFATQIAFEFRMKFKRDVLIDLVCYRRHGHNEADEPSITQPLMYQKIKSMKPLRELYADTLIKEGLIQEEEVKQWMEAYRDRLDEGKAVVKTCPLKEKSPLAPDWKPFQNAKWTDKAKTALSLKTIKALSEQLLTLPEGFNLHPVVKRLMGERAQMTEGKLPLNWGYTEALAFASLIHEGYILRLSGQDSGRGTFSHRHAIVYDQKTGQAYVPLEHGIAKEQGAVEIIDSVLSEEAVLAFEYGYSTSEPAALVIWEAQYGDFVNGAQVVIDQFICSGEQKWGQLCGLVMLLPHGYEGQGPEHTSARLERFLQLCAQTNMQVCVPTTPAQIFHLLRRQMLRKFRKPLIVMSPKSLLRNKLAVSSLEDLSEGRFYNVIDEIEALDKKKVDRVILCSGKVYYELLQKRRDEGFKHAALVRIEQLYPFPEKRLQTLLSSYPKAKKIIWCQEEPKNQGAWFCSRDRIKACLEEGQSLYYIGRKSAAAPAVGSPLLHAKEQEELLNEAFNH